MPGDRQRRRWSEGRGPRRTRTDAARAGHRAGKAVSQAPERVRKAARPAVNHPRWEPYAGKLHVRFCAGCALKAHETMSPEMATAVKPGRQPRTESCVVC